MGRSKGIPNRKTQIFCDLLEKNGIDIVFELCCIIKDGSTPQSLRAAILLDLLKYQFPKRKALEFCGEVGESVNFHLEFGANGTAQR